MLKRNSLQNLFDGLQEFKHDIHHVTTNQAPIWPPNLEYQIQITSNYFHLAVVFIHLLAICGDCTGQALIKSLEAPGSPRRRGKNKQLVPVAGQPLAGPGKADS